MHILIERLPCVVPAREKGLTYEMATDHRMRVYRAMRRADPEGFAALLSRTDLKVGLRGRQHRLSALQEW